MDFETTDENCEFILSAEGVGFLMLTASGCSLRKWQGLTVEDTSICNGIQWGFGPENKIQTLDRNHWVSTARNTFTVARSWKAECGCRLKEVWDWRDPAKLLASLSIEDDGNCQLQSGLSHLFCAIPQWTLSPAGHNNCGQNGAKISLSPEASQDIIVETSSLTRPIRLRCHVSSLNSSAAGEWQLLKDSCREWLETPKDAGRGESARREILTTHKFSGCLKSNETAQLQFDLRCLQISSNKFSSDRHDPQFNFRSSDSKLTSAFINSAASLNQLIQVRADGQLGLQAGLPWFTQFWTRDTCHSFRAAFLWSGRFHEGERLLSELWRKSKGSIIPNYTTPQTTTTNSIDALPLLLLSTNDLLDFCGWTPGIRKLFPIIKGFLTDGARIFSEGGLVRHGPADTWMDAQKNSPNGQPMPCSPRADRAFEIQAFWLSALRRWARVSREDEDFELAKTLLHAYETGINTIQSHYFDESGHRWADTLRPDNSKDFSLRPNIFLGFQALSNAHCLFELLSPAELKRYLEFTIEMNLVVPYGVRTLSPETSVRYPAAINDIYNDQSLYIYEDKIHFHPYHEFGSRSGLEHPDWAYHNGTIWPWLSQSCAELMLLAGLSASAAQLRDTLIFHATRGSQGGALPELLDGLSSHSRWSWPKGAPHQAWSEAAFIQLILEGWIGLKMLNSGKTLLINTSHWQDLDDFSFEFRLLTGSLLIQKSGQTCSIKLSANFVGYLELHHCESGIPQSDDRVYRLSGDQSCILKLCFS